MLDPDGAGLDPPGEPVSARRVAGPNGGHQAVPTSVASLAASFSSSNGVIVTTGPKISSWATAIRLSTLASTVGG